MNRVKIALCQMKVEIDKAININKAYDFINKASSYGADVVVLPEMFNTPYSNEFFREYSESIKDGKTVQMLKKAAKENNIYLVGGSIPEYLDNKVYNTSLVFDREGELIACHRKLHLFDIDIKGQITFKESETLTAGDSITLFETEYGKMGLMICYDIRFPELSRIMALEEAKIIFVPAAFNMTTGPRNWELLFRSRAMDNELFLCGVSPARDLKSSYVAFGNSIITGPRGEVIAILDEKEGILLQDINLEDINKAREDIPVFKHRREDLYNLTYSLRKEYKGL